MAIFFLTYEFHDLTWGDHGDGLSWSFLSKFGSIGAYLVGIIEIWSSLESVDAPPLVFVESVYVILSKFHS